MYKWAFMKEGHCWAFLNPGENFQIFPMFLIFPKYFTIFPLEMSLFMRVFQEERDLSLPQNKTKSDVLRLKILGFISFFIKRKKWEFLMRSEGIFTCFFLYHLTPKKNPNICHHAKISQNIVDKTCHLILSYPELKKRPAKLALGVFHRKIDENVNTKGDYNVIRKNFKSAPNVRDLDGRNVTTTH